LGTALGLLQSGGGSPWTEAITAGLVGMPDTASLDKAYQRVASEGAS
jgi:hypothetical protein